MGHWIYQLMLTCISGQKWGMYFPHLVIALCKRMKVPMSPIEQIVMPARSVLENNMYSQSVDLQQKQVKELNQCRKENMDVPSASKRKSKTKEPLLTGLNDILDMKWTISWIQEMSLVGIDYAKRHGTRVPKPPSKKYTPFLYSNYTKGGEDEDDNQNDDEEGNNDDDEPF